MIKRYVLLLTQVMGVVLRVCIALCMGIFLSCTIIAGLEPRVMSFSPSGNTVDESISEIVISFNEPIFPRSRTVTSSSVTLNGGGLLTFFHPQNDSLIDISGNTITLRGVYLAADTAYTIEIDENFVANRNGIGNRAVRGNAIRFITSSGPSLNSPEPVRINEARTSIALAFDEEVTFANGAMDSSTVQLFNSRAEEIPIDRIELSRTSVAEIDLILRAALEDEEYTLSISADAVEDGSGNTNVNGQAQFTVDTRAPLLTENPFTVNEDGTEITLSFNENIAIVNAGDISLGRVLGIGLMPVQAQVSISESNANELLLMVSNQLNSGNYFVGILANALSDTSGNRNSELIHTLIPISRNNLAENAPPIIMDQSFSVAENTGEGIPFAQVVAQDPDGDTLSYSIIANTLGFTGLDHLVNAATFGIFGDITNRLFDINPNTGELFLASGRSLNYDLLPNMHDIIVQVSDGSHTASANISITETDVSNADVTAPQLTDDHPMYNGSNNPPTITVRYNENIFIANETNISITNSISTNIPIASTRVENGIDLVLTLIAPLSDETYTITINTNAVVDGSDNVNRSETVVFTIVSGIVDVDPPELVQSSHFGTNVQLFNGGNETIHLTFNEVIRFIDGVRGTITIRGETGNIELDTSKSSEVQISAFGRNLDLQGVRLEEERMYSIEIPAGIFEDEAGNPNEAISGNTISFTTIRDTSAPRVSHINNIRNPDQIQIRFSEIIQANKGNITISGGTSSPITIEVTNAAQVNIVDRVLILSKINLQDFTRYTIDIPEGLVTDTSPRRNLNSASTNHLTTGDTTPPVVVSIIPDSKENSSPSLNNIVITFDEYILRRQGLISLQDNTDGSSSIDYNINDANVRIVGSALIIRNVVFDPDTQYTLAIQMGVLNNFTGFVNERIDHSFSIGSNIE